MELPKILSDTCEASDAMVIHAQQRIAQETYCAQLAVYRQYLQNNREAADLYLHQFREYNDRIFQQAIQILDVAIEENNVPLAQAALKTIEVMKSTYPAFCRTFHHLLLGG